MTKTSLVLVCSLGLISCAGTDGKDGKDSPEVGVEKASKSQCPSGGSVLTFGEEEVVVCNGEDGATGAAGEDGSRGVAGPRGATGAPALEGPTGDTGPGTEGIQGPTGAQGEPGATGMPGATGAQGATGEKGDTGATGPVGPQGEPGVTGPQGEAGEAGAVGPQGEKGDPGEDGAFADGLVSATLYCGAELQNGNGWKFKYWATVFADGSVWTSAEVMDSFAATSSSRFYAPTQVGAQTASVDQWSTDVDPAVEREQLRHQPVLTSQPRRTMITGNPGKYRGC